MPSRLVDGVLLPMPLAGHPALDFCNTRAGWGSPAPKEYLHSPRALALWCRQVGLISEELTGQILVSQASVSEVSSAEASVGEAGQGLIGEAAGSAGGDAALRRALVFRDAFYRISLGGTAASDWELVSAEAAAARAVSVLVPGPPATWQLSPARLRLLDLSLPEPSPSEGSPSDGSRSERTPADRAGPGLARIDLLPLVIAGAAEDLLTGPLAGTVSACPGEGCGWLFSDPRARRRWCTMAICGNRAKARRHRTSARPDVSPDA
jgi:hypothetical protein